MRGSDVGNQEHVLLVPASEAAARTTRLPHREQGGVVTDSYDDHLFPLLAPLHFPRCLHILLSLRSSLTFCIIVLMTYLEEIAIGILDLAR